MTNLDAARFFRIMGLSIIIFAAGAGFAALLQAEVVDRIVAFVNGQIITMQEINQELKPMLKEKPDMSPDQVNDLRKKVLDELVNRKILEQESARLGLTVSERELDDAIERIKAANKVTQEILETELARMGIDLVQFRKNIRLQLLQQKIIEKEIRSRIIITEEEIMARHRAAASETDRESKVHLRNILLRLDDESSEAEVMRRAEAIKAEIDKGLKFIDAVNKYSETGETPKRFDMGMVNLSDLAAEIMEAIEELKEGQISRPIRLAETVQILQVVEWDRTGQKLTENTRRRVQEELTAEATEKKFREWLDKAKARAVIKINF